jgi:hypothetical protein
MQHGLRWWGGLLMAGVAAGALAGCASGPAPLAAGPATHSAAAAAAAGSARPYQLYTHCGINEARVGNRYYAAVHPLSDGQGNPPAGWGNPYQSGTMTLQPPASAVFRDAAGHQVRFRLRPGATAFRQVCS